MQVIFRGDPIELERGGGLSRQAITLEGVTFALNVATDASGLSAKLQATNNHFEIVAEDDVAAPAVPPVVDAADEGDPEEAQAAAAHAERAAAKKSKKG